MSEPKYAYSYFRILVLTYAYILIRVCVISMYELAYCFFFCGKVIVDFNGHCICSENWWSRLHRMSVDCLVFILAVCFTIHCSRRHVLNKIQNFFLQKNQINVIGASQKVWRKSCLWRESILLFQSANCAEQNWRYHFFSTCGDPTKTTISQWTRANLHVHYKLDSKLTTTE